MTLLTIFFPQNDGMQTLLLSLIAAKITNQCETIKLSGRFFTKKSAGDILTFCQSETLRMRCFGGEGD